MIGDLVVKPAPKNTARVICLMARVIALWIFSGIARFNRFWNRLANWLEKEGAFCILCCQTAISAATWLSYNVIREQSFKL
jgi:hypothetical protein